MRRDDSSRRRLSCAPRAQEAAEHGATNGVNPLGGEEAEVTKARLMQRFLSRLLVALHRQLMILILQDAQARRLALPRSISDATPAPRMHARMHAQPTARMRPTRQRTDGASSIASARC